MSALSVEAREGGLTTLGGERMSKKQINKATVSDNKEVLALVKKIGKTTYRVRIHFSTTNRETMSDKIKRMLRNEVQQM